MLWFICYHSKTCSSRLLGCCTWRDFNNMVIACSALMASTQNISISNTQHCSPCFTITCIFNNEGHLFIWSYLESLKIPILFVTVKYYVIGHAETFSHSKVIEEGRLAGSVTHLNHCYICVGNKNREGQPTWTAWQWIRHAACLHLPAL